MIDFYIYILVFMSLCLIAAISIIAKQHLRNRALETLLENTNEKLESLQVSFGRFTPHERLALSGFRNEFFDTYKIDEEGQVTNKATGEVVESGLSSTAANGQ